MDQYHILKTIHKVGHPMIREVMSYENWESDGFYVYDIELKAQTAYKAIVKLYGRVEDFKEEYLPAIGSTIRTVIQNYVDDTLYLSIEPEDLEKVSEYEDFYQFIEKIEEGTIITGKAKSIVPFGVFVDLSFPYLGLIDLGHRDSSGLEHLPHDFAEKIKEGDEVKCVISDFRFHNKQISLRWLEKNNNEPLIE